MDGNPAQCSLRSFLDQPDAAPPGDWVDAVTHDGGVDTDDLVERATQARRRAEKSEQRIADLSQVPTARPAVDRATGVLVAVFNVGATRAFECLAWVAEQTGTTIDAAADRFLGRVDGLGADAHDRDTLLAVLDDLVEHSDARAS